MALIELAERPADDDLQRELGQFVLQRLMEAEAEVLYGAGRHERHPDRVNQRNGYRERTLLTRPGSLELQTPKLRVAGDPAITESGQPSAGVRPGGNSGAYERPGCSLRKRQMKPRGNNT